ncbi:MAG: hypothetical protein J6X38_00700, partial [Abditibacteriota bacterium]|nr:hypothetical protein [Abditibacteriota bacterium]
EKINLTETEKAVFLLMSTNPHIKREDILTETKIGKGTLDRAIKSLKDKGLIERVGPNKTGYWRVLTSPPASDII